MEGRKLNFYIYPEVCGRDRDLHDFGDLETKNVFILDTLLSWTISDVFKAP